ncbi:MAG: hypothetical protein J2P25_14435 [Nocardiopsaceae bacterium]|nr:hypothetical protein [Nocardiopsaceae bacterium]
MTAEATSIPRAPETAAALDEYRRWTPEEVIANRWLPYKSARVLKEKCYRREVRHHSDGGRITFTLDDIRCENERSAVTPAA